MRHRGSIRKLPTAYPPDTQVKPAGQGTIQGTGDATVPFVSVRLSEHVKSPAAPGCGGCFPPGTWYRTRVAQSGRSYPAHLLGLRQAVGDVLSQSSARAHACSSMQASQRIWQRYTRRGIAGPGNVWSIALALSRTALNRIGAIKNAGPRRHHSTSVTRVRARLKWLMPPQHVGDGDRRLANAAEAGQGNHCGDDHCGDRITVSDEHTTVTKRGKRSRRWRTLHQGQPRRSGQPARPTGGGNSVRAHVRRER